MVLIVLSVYDRAAQAYGRPLFMPAVGVAVRSFTDEVNREDAQNDMFKHPEHFELFELGSFDDSSGRFTLHQDPRSVCAAVNVSTKPPVLKSVKA